MSMDASPACLPGSASVTSTGRCGARTETQRSRRPYASRLPEIAAFYPYDKLDELVANFPFYNNPPVESDEYVTFEEASTPGRS
jgi:hypothetical protein